MSEDLSSTKDGQSTVNEAIRMPATFVEALATLVKAVQHENQLIAAVVVGIVAIILPIVAIVSSVEDRKLAVVLLIAAVGLIFLASATFLAAFMLVRFQKKGKRTFSAEHHDELRQQLLHAQNALNKMRGRVEPISDDVQTLMKERNISGERAVNLQRQLAELLRYLHSEERQVNEWLGRLASLANMDMAADAKARKARWQARKVSEEQKEQQLKKASQTKQ